jgi:hypothetical protein
MPTHLDVAGDLAAAPADAWRVLSDTRWWPAWGPSVTAVDADAHVIAAGARGRVRLLGGLWVPFEITDLVPGERWAWRVAGIPATGHRVEPRTDGCRVVFEVPVLAAPYAAVCRIALRRLEQLLATPD